MQNSQSSREEAKPAAPLFYQIYKQILLKFYN